MSKFSAYLQSLIDRNGESISQIAKNTGIERTSIHKALKDERNLSEDSLKQLAHYLKLTISETRELNLLYEMKLYGEDAFQTQASILELLSELSQLSFISHKNISLPMFFETNDIPELVYGRPQIEAVIQAIFQLETEKSGAEISLYLPQNHDIAPLLLQLWKAERVFKVNQVVSFIPNHVSSATNQENLGLLKKIMPLSFLSRGNYSACYFFEKSANSVDISPMPYFIITPRCLITFDGKLSVMQIQTSKSLLKLYKKRFANIVKECSPLINYYNVKSIIEDVVRFLTSYTFITNNKKDECKSCCAMMTQPSLGYYITDEIVEENIKDDLPGKRMLVPIVQRHFKLFHENCSDLTMFFTEEGLRSFAETGIINDLPPKIAKPFNIGTRLFFFKSFTPI